MTNRETSHTLPRRLGFTLVELMVTVAVVAILLAIGAPQLQSFMFKQRVAADIDTLGASMHLARSEALKRSGRVSVCPLPSGQADRCVSTATKDWSHGWMVFINYPSAASNDNEYDSARDTLLRVEQAVRSGSVTSNVDAIAVSFQANGLALGDAQTFTVQPANTTGDPSCRQVTLSAQGRLFNKRCS